MFTKLIMLLPTNTILIILIHWDQITETTHKIFNLAADYIKVIPKFTVTFT